MYNNNYSSENIKKFHYLCLTELLFMSQIAHTSISSFIYLIYSHNKYV